MFVRSRRHVDSGRYARGRTKGWCAMTEPTPRATVAAAHTPLIELVITEPLDSRGAGRLHRLLAEALDLVPDRVVVDLSDCSFVDAAAVNVLLDAHRKAWRSGGRLTLRCPSPRLRRLFELAHVSDVFDITYEGPARPGPTSRRDAGTAQR
jgi:anti-anti-sigma factor